MVNLGENMFFGDRYQEIGVLGKGATSVVFQAKDIELNRHVAIKIPKANIISEKPHYRDILIKEARYLASLDHPNVIPLYEYYESNNGPVLVMRYVESSLFHHIGFIEKHKELPVVEISNQIALATDFCRKNGVAHRDIKPDNILIDMSGHAYLTDFGIAAKLDNLKEWKQAVGNPAYMSPEQLLGKKFFGASVNYEKSDQFSLGITIYQMITGKLPHNNNKEEKHHFTSLKLIKGERIIPCFERNSTIPTSVDDVLSRMMSINPDNRYSSNIKAVDEFCEYFSGRKKDIKAFVSFSHKDHKYVEDFKNQLEKYEISVWWDRKIEHGQYWEDKVEEAMISSDVMIVFISPDSARSKEAKNEWRYWLDYFDKPLIPIMISECRPPYRLSPIQRIFAIDKDIENVAVETAEAIRKSLKMSKQIKYQELVTPMDSITTEMPDNEKITTKTALKSPLDLNVEKYLPSSHISLRSINPKELYIASESIYIPQRYKINQNYLPTFTNKENIQHLMKLIQ